MPSARDDAPEYDTYSGNVSRSNVGSLSRLSVAACTMLLLGSLGAQSLVTLTAKGTVLSGTDYGGVFTSLGGDLSNLPFTLTITADTSYLEDRYGLRYHTARTAGIGVAMMFEGDLTINGRSFDWQLKDGFGTVDVFQSPKGLSFGMTADTVVPIPNELDVYVSIGLASGDLYSGLSNAHGFNQGR